METFLFIKKNIEAGGVFSPTAVLKEISSKLLVAELNSLDSSFQDIRNQMALGLRGLSVKVWNEYQDLNTALGLINIAAQIGTVKDVNENILAAKGQLVQLKINSETTIAAKAKEEESSNTGCIVFVLIIVVIGIIIAVNDSKKSGNNTTYTPQASDRVIPETKYEPIIESAYKGNQLKNGASPFNNCFGKGVYGGNATLTVKNGSSSDAIVCLYDIGSGRTTRNEYIKKNSEFVLTGISQGYYRIRVVYGNDWNPNKLNTCGSKGNFDSDLSYSEFDNPTEFVDDQTGFTVSTVTLYSVAGGNATTTTIDPSQLFNK